MPQTWKLFEPCPAEDYQLALLEIRGRMSKSQFQLLKAQYAAPHKTVTAPQLARAVGYTYFSPANLHYGKLGRLLSEVIGRTPRTQVDGRTVNWWAVLSTGIDDPAGFQWVMHPQLAEALERLGWVTQGIFDLPEEILETDTFTEGAVKRVWVNAYERNREARSACIGHYGARCYVCGFDFANAYGPDGEGFIHVHHERPLSEIGETYHVDPIADLKPVCPNCHAMIHRKNPAFPVSEVRSMLLNH